MSAPSSYAGGGAHGGALPSGGPDGVGLWPPSGKEGHFPPGAPLCLETGAPRAAGGNEEAEWGTRAGHGALMEYWSDEIDIAIGEVYPLP